ncbi:hypothetical protein [Streptomyces sp. NPDC002758]
MKTGPQRYPGASTAYWFGSKYPGSPMESNVIVWHTTEGTSLPSYAGGAEAPNFTAKPDFAAKRLVWYQHFDFDVSSRALVNAAGGVETNTLNVVQVEIVGTCDPSTHKKWGSTQHLYTPELPDWAIRDLAAFAKWAHDNHGVPLTSSVTFNAYPGSYGTSNGVRMSASKWTGFTGHCGHQHVPENLHGDPGLLPMAAILDAAQGGTPTQPQEDPVAITDADAQKIARMVLTLDGVIDNPNAATAKDNPYISAATGFRNIETVTRRTDARLAALQATNDQLVKAVAQLASGFGGLDPAAIVAELKTAIESITVHLDVPNA